MNRPPLGDTWLRDVRRKLLRWYARCGRDLPWRRQAGDPYAAWVSEIMLQQTQAETVVPYYERFLRRFPNLQRLAAAGLDDVLGHWQGLGYYRRAENLHRAARQLAAQPDGWPRTADEWVRLPGIGRYTAGAIASIACGQRAAAVDGNVARVLTRLAAIQDDPTAAATQSAIWEIAGQLLPSARRSGDFNQALMDLGATVCRPVEPACGQCPVKAHCQARHRKLVNRIPAPRRRPTAAEVNRVVLALVIDRRLLMRQRPSGGRWSGLWELPNAPGQRREATSIIRNLCAEWKLVLSSAERPVYCGLVTHRLTHRLYRFRVFAVQLDHGVRPPRRRGYRWVRLPVAPSALPVATAHRRLLDLLPPARTSAPREDDN